MSLTSESLAKNNSLESFVTALGINAGLLIVEVSAFIILKARLERIYTPRTILPPPEKRAEVLPRGPWRWFPALLISPSTDIIRKNGLDAYLMIRFLQLMAWIFGAFTLVTWVILLPVNSVNIPGDDRDGLARLQWGNISPNSQDRYWAHCLVAYVLTFFVLWLLRREMFNFVHIRHQYLISKHHSRLAQTKTVLITSLPKELTDPKELSQFFSFVPGGVQRVWIYRNSPELPQLFEDRLEACKKLEGAECDLIRAVLKAARKENKNKKRDDEPRVSQQDPGALLGRAELAQNGGAHLNIPRPTHRIGKVPLIGRKVDTIDWCKNEIVRLNGEIEKARQALDRCEPHGSAFVQCNLQMGAHVLAQCVSYHEPFKMSQKWVGVAPEDIVWANIDDGAFEVRARYVTSWLATIALIVLWSFPVAFVGLLSNVDQLCTTVSWLEWICRLPSGVQGLIQGVAPPLFLAILFLLLPIVLKGLAWYECIPRYSLMSVSVYKRYFLFLIIHGFLVVSLSSGLTAAIPQILKNPGSIVESLAIRLPDASIFFLTYIVAQGFTGAGGALLQAGPLILYYIRKWFLGNTPRETYAGTFIMPNVDLGTTLPRLSLLASIAIAYSVISPIINILAFAAFGLFFVAWKFLFTWVLDQPDAFETAGLYFPLLISNLFVGLYIEEICLAGLFFLATDANGSRSSIPQGVLMVVLIAITFTTQVLLHKAFDPITDYLPMSLATKQMAQKFAKHKSEGKEGKEGKEDKEESGVDLFSRDRIRSVVRRKLRLKPGHRISRIKVDKPDAERRSDEPILPPIAEGSTAVYRTNSGGSKKSKASSKKEKPFGGISIDPAALKLKSGANDADSSDDDDDLEEHAFDHPSTYVDAPWIWIPKDELGFSNALLEELKQAGVEASDLGASINERGTVTVTRNPPDEDWSGGHDV